MPGDAWERTEKELVRKICCDNLLLVCAKVCGGTMTWRGLTEEDLCFRFSCTCLACIRSGQYATGCDSGESTIVDYCPELYVIALVHVMCTECNIGVDGGHRDIAFCCKYVVITYVCCLWI